MPTNVNDASFFELRLAQEVCALRALEFKYEEDLKQTRQLVAKSHGTKAEEKIQTQEGRLAVGFPVFMARVDEIEQSMRKRLSDVDWTGRQNIGDRVADLDLHFGAGHVVPTSVKSGGPGTERNLGGSSIRDLLGYDSSADIRTMFGETLTALNEVDPDTDFGSSWEEIRDAVKNHPDHKRMRLKAKQVGAVYQMSISNAILVAWKNASPDQKLAVLEYLALQNDVRDKGLQIFIAEDDGAYFKGVLDLVPITAQDLDLQANAKSKKGTLDLCIAGSPHWRICVNFTNGIGLSPLAVRCFRY